MLEMDIGEIRSQMQAKENDNHCSELDRRIESERRILQQLGAEEKESPYGLSKFEAFDQLVEVIYSVNCRSKRTFCFKIFLNLLIIAGE